VTSGLVTSLRSRAAMSRVVNIAPELVGKWFEPHAGSSGVNQVALSGSQVPCRARGQGHPAGSRRRGLAEVRLQVVEVRGRPISTRPSRT
jgi:hypothetical protein